jgi:hypothetical protein
MKLTAEVSIPIDDKRSIWMTAYADDVEPDQLAAAATGLQEALTGQALAAYSIVAPTQVDTDAAAIVAAASRRKETDVPAQQRPPRPEDPESMRTFGEEEEDRDAD